jgi:hypothetical protein
MSTNPVGNRPFQLSMLPPEIQAKLEKAEKAEAEKLKKKEELKNKQCFPKVVHLSSESDNPIVSSTLKWLEQTQQNPSPPKKQPLLQRNIVDMAKQPLKRPPESDFDENSETKKFQRTQEPDFGNRPSQLSRLPPEIKEKLNNKQCSPKVSPKISPKVVHLSSESDNPIVFSTIKLLEQTQHNPSPPKKQPLLQGNIVDMAKQSLKRFPEPDEDDLYEEALFSSDNFNESSKLPSQSILERLQELNSVKLNKIMAEGYDPKNVEKYEYFEACKKLMDFQKLELPGRALIEISKYKSGLPKNDMIRFLPENNWVVFEEGKNFNFILKETLDFPNFYYSSRENPYKYSTSHRKENLFCIGKMLEKIRDNSGIKSPERLDNLIKSMTVIPQENHRAGIKETRDYISQLDQIRSHYRSSSDK